MVVRAEVNHDCNALSLHTREREIWLEAFLYAVALTLESLQYMLIHMVGQVCKGAKNCCTFMCWKYYKSGWINLYFLALVYLIANLAKTHCNTCMQKFYEFITNQKRCNTDTPASNSAIFFDAVGGLSRFANEKVRERLTKFCKAGSLLPSLVTQNNTDLIKGGFLSVCIMGWKFYSAPNVSAVFRFQFQRKCLFKYFRLPFPLRHIFPPPPIMLGVT